jgi:heme/copper-type cytochrome/quinol oxidase subunit 2
VLGYTNLVLLAGIRYLGICKSYVATKVTAITILVLSSAILMILIITIAALSDSNPNQGYLFCSIKFKHNAVAKTMNLAISFLLILFFVAYSICYFNIGKVYYKNITSLEKNTLELNSLGTGRQHQIFANSRYLEPDILRNNQSSTNEYKPKFLAIKVKLMLKFFSMIILPFLEIFPICILLIFDHFVGVYGNELMENICYWIAEFSPLTSSLMILFLHRETREEFYNLVIHN